MDYDFIELQKDTEYRYSRKHVLKAIKDYLLADPDIQMKVNEGRALLNKWLNTKTFHETKVSRLRELQDLDTRELAETIITHSSIYFGEPELFVSFTSQLSSILGFSDKSQAIATIAEIVVVLAELDVYDIVKPSRNASLMVISRINLPQEMRNAVERSHYLPPMLIEPDLVFNNYQSPYLTFNDCQILGKGNGHTEDICLDVINTQNSVQLRLNVEFLDRVDEDPTHELDTIEKEKEWAKFKQQSREVYALIADTGNAFWLTHKVDKRGRLYANGYHVTTQGSPFKKAMIELAEPEHVTGI